MGIIWRSTMPLLSTLAALVIIVHSAEEDLESEYRYDLRPRAIDTGTQNYEQPWRVIEAEPMMKHTTQSDWDTDSREEPPKRRRKRKRRPIETSAEDVIPKERYPYPEAPMPSSSEIDYSHDYKTTEMPRRRRNRINQRSNIWSNEYTDSDRPFRRRGLRKKRPTLATWPELSEFSGHRRGKTQINSDEDTNDMRANKKVIVEHDGEFGDYDSELRHLENNPDTESNNKFVLDSHKTDDMQNYKPLMKQDKSLSEFSIESADIQNKPKNEVEDTTWIEKVKDKTPIIENDKKDQEPIKPTALKEILKRSNGTSLSEILQVHNLSLTDLLHGKVNAISLLNSDNELESYRRKKSSANTLTDTPVTEVMQTQIEIEASESKTLDNAMNQPNTNNSEPEALEDIVANTSIESLDSKNMTKHESDKNENYKNKQNGPRFANRRRAPIGIRKKLRMRPVVSNAYKAQLSRDIINLNSTRRYLNKRNATKSREWKSLIPLILNNKGNNETRNSTMESETTTAYTITTTIIPEVTTPTETDFDKLDLTTITIPEEVTINEDKYENDTETKEFISVTTDPITTVYENKIIIQKPIATPLIKQNQLNASSVRRQAFNNRIKKKRLKQKSSTTEAPQNEMTKGLFGLGNLVSSSEFIAKTTIKKEISEDDYNKDFGELEDFLTTAMSKNIESSTKSIHNPNILYSTTPKAPSTWSTTEETAKFEIEEILNDTRTSARLSKILMERNMTLHELVEHRERGSSHVHLADIFHNASREPNPPEPFLSKSLIEPISKETYPLRALLEANLHDPTAKTTTEDSSLNHANYINIPVAMDFGNNVNENAENMGIMSLFNNFTDSATSTHKTIHKDGDETAYESSIVNVMTTKINDINRESRVLNENQDMVGWNEIFAMIRNNRKNETKEIIENYTKEVSSPETFKKITLEEDVDGDGLIVLEDLQHLRDFDSNIASASDEKLEVNSYERSETASSPGILNKMPSTTKSITVVTASIVGLAMVLFLLTYAIFKWIQQKKKQIKRYTDERIPTPVFENRKGHKNNSSSRSISPMLSSSNIYTMNTVDSHHGKDSPEYMWDTLRKPFQ